jgi:peptidoglycan/xylan/chitin deacetylase (PgdA/CDA1 family)
MKPCLYLTFDIEPYWVTIPAEHSSKHWEEACDASLQRFYDILDVCEDLDVKATFFFVGLWAKKYPDAVKMAFKQGHTIGSHSLMHEDLSELDDELLLLDLLSSKNLIEDIIGIPVVHFRAPSFSIRSDQIKIIQKAGYKYDSSTTDALRFYGGLNTLTTTNDHTLQLITFKGMKILGRNLTILGGGYLRLIPEWLLRALCKHNIGNMVYLHPVDFENSICWYRFLSLSSNLRKNIKLGRMGNKLKILSEHYKFNGLPHD